MLSINSQDKTEKNPKKNVILITLDDFSYKIFSENIEMFPNMRNIVNNFASFENAFSVGSATFYAFPGIIGGIYPYNFGIGIDKNIKPIDDILKEYGYNTALINEANALLTPFFGYARNMDYQNHFLNLSHADVDRRLEDSFIGDDDFVEDRELKIFSYIREIYYNVDNELVKKGGKIFFGIFKFIRLYLSNNSECFEEREKLYSSFHSDILNFISEKFKQPQFLWIHTIINHQPYFPVQDTEKFTLNQINYLNYRAVSWLVSPQICKKLKILYIESMRRTDELLGDIFTTLESNNLLNNTIIVITADHGEEFMEEGYSGHSFESSSDRLLNVPLMFFSPGMINEKKVTVPVSTIDIIPTLLDLLDLNIPNNFRGVSLKELLINEPKPRQEDQRFLQRPIFSEGWTTKGLLDRNPGWSSKKRVFTVRKGQYKLKITQKREGKEKIIEMFELSNWVNGERLDLVENNQIFEELQHLIYNHIYEEGLFAKSIRRRSEKQTINKRLDRIRQKI